MPAEQNPHQDARLGRLLERGRLFSVGLDRSVGWRRIRPICLWLQSLGRVRRSGNVWVKRGERIHYSLFQINADLRITIPVRRFYKGPAVVRNKRPRQSSGAPGRVEPEKRTRQNLCRPAPGTHPDPRTYSSLSATIGSIPAARRAGIQLDRNAIAMIVTAIAENTSGSLGLTW